jgi:Flp pilus assembly protein TadD|tara:strand:- start:700 stop:960 length:261 start_codon:yes stop_codon:yes gene_type:complete
LLDDLDRLDAMKAANADAGNYVRRGGVYNKQGELEKAIADVTKAIELDPANAKIYYFRGATFEKLGDKENAEADYAKAKELGFEPE